MCARRRFTNVNYPSLSELQYGTIEHVPYSNIEHIYNA